MIKRHPPTIPRSSDSHKNNGYPHAHTSNVASTEASGVAILSVHHLVALLGAAYIWGGLSFAIFFNFGHLNAALDRSPLNLIQSDSHLRAGNSSSHHNDATRLEPHNADSSEAASLEDVGRTKLPSSDSRAKQANAPSNSTAEYAPPLSCKKSIKECCEASIRNPPEKIDIVIPYKYREAADACLMYELRSFEKSGLMDHVGKVFIMTNSREETELMEDRYQKYLDGGGKQLHIIAADEIKVPFKFPQWRNGGKK